MTRSTSRLLALMVMIGLAADYPLPTPAAAASPPFFAGIEAFTTAEYPIANPDNLPLTVWRLDKRNDITAELSRGLPNDPAAATMEARRRFAANRERIQAQVKEALAPLQRAAELGVQRYPAIVFDGKQVVYGTTDLPIAIAIYQAHNQVRR